MKTITLLSISILFFVSGCSMSNSGTKSMSTTNNSNSTTDTQSISSSCPSDQWAADGATSCSPCPDVTNGGTGLNTLNGTACGCVTGKEWNASTNGCSSPVIISFQDNRVLKIKSNGGSGYNFMGVNDTSSTFSAVSGFDYYTGYSGWGSKYVTAMLYADGYTLMAFSNGDIIKLDSFAGSGADFDHVTACTPAAAHCYADGNNYGYLKGYDSFSSAITAMTYGGGHTLIAFANGKILSVKGTGGIGSDFLAVTENTSCNSTSCAGFSTLPGYVYYEGDTYFSSAVTSMMYAETTNLTNNITTPTINVLIAFKDGRLLKVNTIGGGAATGANLFDVSDGCAVLTPPTLSFNCFSSTGSFYQGYDKFSSSYITAIVNNKAPDEYYNYTLFAFADGRVLKIYGTGTITSNGANFLKVINTPSGCTTNCTGFANNAGPNYVGHDYFNINTGSTSIPVITSMLYAQGATIIGLGNGSILKVRDMGNPLNANGSNYGSLFHLTTGTSPSFWKDAGTGYEPSYVGENKLSTYVTSMTTK